MGLDQGLQQSRNVQSLEALVKRHRLIRSQGMGAGTVTHIAMTELKSMCKHYCGVRICKPTTTHIISQIRTLQIKLTVMCGNIILQD